MSDADGTAKPSVVPTGALVFLVALAVRELWAWVLPLDAGSDEIFHLHTSWTYHALGRLAVLGQDPATASYFHPVYRFAEMGYFAGPPGAHGAGALLFSLGPHGPWLYLWLRQLAVLGGALSAWLAWLALAAVWPRRSMVPACVGALFTLAPHVVFTTATFSDEWLGLLAAGIVYYGTVLLLRDGLRAPGLARAGAGLALLGVARLTYWPAGFAVL